MTAAGHEAGHEVARVGRLSAFDGLRGVAAIAVVGYHARGFFPAAPDLPGSYLAVDLFFALSGFVLAHAYGGRFDAGLGLGGFMKLRLERLYPLYLLGAIGGVVMVLPQALGGDLSRMLAAPFNLLMAPTPTTLSEGGGLYPINPPGWSLFYELVINAALVVGWTKFRRWGGLLLGVAALGLATASWLHHGLNGGARWADGWVAAARVIFTFSAGVTISRWRGRRPAPALPAIGLVAAFILAVSLPIANRAVWDLLVAALLVPALTWAGATARSGPLARRAFSVLGEASYPLYVLHVPMLWASKMVMLKTGLHYGWWTPAVLLPLFVLASWLASRLYDEPLRRFLKNRARARPAPPAVS